MAEIKGVVEQVSFKEVNTKFGLKKTYSVKVGGNWVSCGFKDPKVAAGDAVVCDAESTTYGLQTKAISKTTAFSSADSSCISSASTATSVSSSAPRSGGTSYAGAKVFPVPPLHGDRSIIRQNVLSRATELYIAAYGGKAFGITQDAVDIIIEYARKFEAYATGDLDLRQAEAEMKAAGLAVPDSEG